MTDAKVEAGKMDSVVANEGDGIDLASVPTPLKAPVGFFQRHRRNFFVVLAIFVLGFLANALLSDAYEKFKPWKDSDDEFIDKIIAAQKVEFESLNANLASIRGSLPAEGREAFKDLERSIAGLERQSAGLVQQLSLAQQEVASLREVAESRGGLGSGYDFTLAGNTSMDLAPGAVIGLSRVEAGWVSVNLTSQGQSVFSGRTLRNGGSVNYVGAGGRECFVSLLSTRQGNPGAASFKTGCIDARAG